MTWIKATALALLVAGATAGAAAAQETAPAKVLNVNTATEAELRALPHMTPAIVTAMVAKRPFASITDLNTFLLAQKLTPEQTAAFYAKAFVPIKLNTATPEEILLVPGAGKRMVHEFDEYRPWKTRAQFMKEIGKYVGEKEAARLWQYVVID